MDKKIGAGLKKKTKKHMPFNMQNILMKWHYFHLQRKQRFWVEEYLLKSQSWWVVHFDKSLSRVQLFATLWTVAY